MILRQRDGPPRKAGRVGSVWPDSDAGRAIGREGADPWSELSGAGVSESVAERRGLSAPFLLTISRS